MKKIAYLASAVLAALGFSSAANADITATGFAGVTAINGSGANTTIYTGGGVSFAMSTTTAGGMTVSLDAGVSQDTNDVNGVDGRSVTGLDNVTFASGDFSVSVGNAIYLSGSETGTVGGVAGAAVDDGGYTQTGMTTGAPTEGMGFSASTAVGGASVTLSYLLDYTNTATSGGVGTGGVSSNRNSTATSGANTGTGLAVSMPVGAMTLSLGYASSVGATAETHTGGTISMALGNGTVSAGYASTDQAADSTATSLAYSGSLDADTTYALGYATGETTGVGSSTQMEARIARSLGGGVSVFADIQNLNGAGTSGTNMAFGTSISFTE
jgi:hypothetical protein